jgi:hypothetical protein
MCSAQQTTCNAQQTPCKMRKTSCSMHYGSMHDAADATANNRSRATCTKQRATAIGQRIATSKQRAECNSQQTADDVQQTADDMQEDACSVLTHASCNGKHTALPHLVRGEQRAAHNQPACATYCTRQPVRNTARTPHTRCTIRPVSQRSFQQTQIKIHGVRRTKSGSSRTSGVLSPPGSVKSYPLPRKIAPPLREIRCPKLVGGRVCTRGGGRERMKLAKRQEAAEAKQHESAPRSRRKQLVKGTLH